MAKRRRAATVVQAEQYMQAWWHSNPKTQWADREAVCAAVDLSAVCSGGQHA